MSNTTRNAMWLHFGKAASEAPRSPIWIIVALVFTALAASMVIAREATNPLQAEIMAGGARTYPSGVFRAPYPAIFAPGPSSFGH